MVKPRFIGTLRYTITTETGEVVELFNGRWPSRRVHLGKLGRRVDRQREPQRTNRLRRSRMRSLYGQRRR